MNNQDKALRRTWHNFCDELKAAGDLVFEEGVPDSAVTRATGLRLLARNLSLAMQFQMENCDSKAPELLHYFDPLRKQGGDNSDALYVGAPVNGEDTYVVQGNRGTAPYFAVTLVEDGDTPWGGQVVGRLMNDELETDAEGNFTLVISPRPHEGNWIQSTPGSWRVTFRQFFTDWEKERPMVAVIERAGGCEPPGILTPERLEEGLMSSARWLKDSVSYWAKMLNLWQEREGEFLEYGELESRAIDFTPGGAPVIAYWTLPPGEALVLEVLPPRCDYWAVEFGNYWWETMDYRYRLCNTNEHFAALEDDGRLLVVVSHDDPGHPNWLDPSGHEAGYITYRWIGAEHYPRPAMRRVKLAHLADVLEGSRSISADQRREQIAGRRRGVARRFGS